MSRLLALLVLVTSSALPVGAASAADGKADFEAALQQLSKLMDGRKWKAAESLLQRQLAEHADQSYVREHLAQIKESLKRCAFEVAFPRKGASDALCGEVLSYDSKSGEIELRYKRIDPSTAGKASKGAEPRDVPFPCADFEQNGKERVLRLPFDGPYSIELIGTAMDQLNPKVRVGIGQIETYLVTFDFGSLSTIKVGSRTLVSSSTFANVLRPYKIKISVRDTQIDATHNGTRIVLAEKDKETLGQVGFADFANLDEIRLTGKANRAWIEERIEARTKVGLAEFEKTYDAEASLPQWLRTK